MLGVVADAEERTTRSRRRKKRADDDDEDEVAGRADEMGNGSDDSTATVDYQQLMAKVSTVPMDMLVGPPAGPVFFWISEYGSPAGGADMCRER